MDTKQKNRPEETGKKAPQSGQKSGQRPAKSRPAEAGSQARQRRAEAQSQSRQHPAAQRTQPKAAASRTGEAQRKSQRPRPADYGQVTVPKGTGPRKSAPQGKASEHPVQKRPLTVKNDKKTRTLKQNPLQNFISGVRGGNQVEEDPQSEQAKKRRQKRAAEAARKRRRAQMHDTPAVIYTAPAAFNWNRLLVQMLTVTAVVLALVMGLSVFFKVEHITVSGAEKYSTWAVREASGIKEGDKLLTFSIPRASGQIKRDLADLFDDFVFFAACFICFMMEMIQMMQEMFPEGMGGGDVNSSPMDLFSAMSGMTGGDNNSSPMDMLSAMSSMMGGMFPGQNDN